MRLFIIAFILTVFSGCHRKELPSTQLRKEMRSANMRSVKAQKKLMKENKKRVGKKKKRK